MSKSASALLPDQQLCETAFSSAFAVITDVLHDVSSDGFWQTFALIKHNENNGPATCCARFLADLDGRGLERGDVRWDSLPGRGPVRHVVVDILHSADPVWKLYPFER